MSEKISEKDKEMPSTTNKEENEIDSIKSDRDSYDTRQVNIDDIISRIPDAPTEVIEAVKGLDANRYATKKTVAQGMLDIALLTSNASQLKYVLQVGPRHEFYTMLVVLISISIVLQVFSALVAVILGCILNINRVQDQKRAEIFNNTSLAFKILGISVNIIIGIFYSIHVDDSTKGLTTE